MKTALKETTRIGRTTALCLALAAAVSLSLAGVADTAHAKEKKGKKVEQIVFASDRSSGEGVDNPTGDDEIFVMNPDGSEIKQLTFNTVTDAEPTLSPDGKKIAFASFGKQSSNPDGDDEVYLMNALDGSDQQNLSDNSGISDTTPDFSPNGKKIAFASFGAQPSNPDGDGEVYLMNADGSKQQNLTNTAIGISDEQPDFSPNGKKIAYRSNGVQSSNPDGDNEVYLMNALDGSGQ
jgi:Tol biopolymer transport system component